MTCGGSSRIVPKGLNGIVARIGGLAVVILKGGIEELAMVQFVLDDGCHHGDSRVGDVAPVVLDICTVDGFDGREVAPRELDVVAAGEQGRDLDPLDVLDRLVQIGKVFVPEEADGEVRLGFIAFDEDLDTSESLEERCLHGLDRRGERSDLNRHGVGFHLVHVE